METQVTTDEAEEIFNCSPRYRFIESGDVEGENLYAALGQTEAGRYLTVYFVRKKTGEALVVSARDMTHQEKRGWQIERNAILFPNISKASPKPEIFGTVTIWVTIGI